MHVGIMGHQQATFRRRSFDTLNGLRGFAALAVLLWHFDWPAKTGIWNAGLSVDLFFLLSGFVIAHAYEDRLRAGWPARRFFIVRAIRLWPLYVLGSAIGLGALVYGMILSGSYWQIKSLAFYALWSATLFPQMLHIDRIAFPLNSPAWSLFLELLINVAYAVFGFRLGNRALFIVTAAGLFWLSATVFASGAGMLPPDWRADGIWIVGVPRVAFSFPLGVLLYRLWRAGSLPRVRLPAWAIIIAFLVLLCCAVRGDSRISSLCVVALGWPLILVLGVNTEPGEMGRRLFTLLADISYPLYATHIGFYMFAGASVAMVDHDLAFGLAAVAALAFAIPADRYYDQPVRRWLTRALEARALQANAASPL